MTSLSFPGTADGISEHPDGLYVPLSIAADEATAIPELEVGSEEATAGEWADSLRRTVRDHPLAAIATAAMFGMLVTRLTR
jgi:hypothetical protein